MKRALAILALCGCDGVSSHPLAPDARAEDAPNDATPSFTRHYVIDKLIYPTSTTDARTWSFDFGTDGVADNTLGAVFVELAQQGLAPQTRSDFAVQHGDVLLLGELGSVSADFVDGAATFTLFAGANPIPGPCGNGPQDAINCGKHLGGDGSFDLSPTSPRDTPLVGTFASGMLLTEPGRLGMSIAFGEAPIALDLLAARVQITTTTPFGASGTIAGAVTESQIDTIVVPGLAAALDAAIADDCHGAPPNCDCTPGSNGEKLQGTFDTNDNCSVGATELGNSSLVHQLLQPDVMVDETMAASFSLRFTAVTATFTP